MEARDEADGTLVVSHESAGWPRWLFAIGVVLAAVAAWNGFAPSGKSERVAGSIGGAVTCLGAALVMAESGRFVFDRKRRAIEWRRRWAWWRGGGTLAFDEVEQVLCDRPLGDEGVPSRRVSLRLASGKELPLSAGYVPDTSGELRAIAQRIRVVLGLDQERAGTTSPSFTTQR